MPPWARTPPLCRKRRAKIPCSEQIGVNAIRVLSLASSFRYLILSSPPIPLLLHACSIGAFHLIGESKKSMREWIQACSPLRFAMFSLEMAQNHAAHAASQMARLRVSIKRIQLWHSHCVSEARDVGLTDPKMPVRSWILAGRHFVTSDWRSVMSRKLLVISSLFVAMIAVSLNANVAEARRCCRRTRCCNVAWSGCNTGCNMQVAVNTCAPQNVCAINSCAPQQIQGGFNAQPAPDAATAAPPPPEPGAAPAAPEAPAAPPAPAAPAAPAAPTPAPGT